MFLSKVILVAGVIAAMCFQQVKANEPVTERSCNLVADNNAKIMIFVRADCEHQKEVSLSQRDLAYLVRQHLLKVYPGTVNEALGNKMELDYVVRLNVHTLRMLDYSPGDKLRWVECSAALLISVVNARDLEEDPIYEEEYTLTADSSWVLELDLKKHQRGFLDRIAKDVAARFAGGDRKAAVKEPDRDRQSSATPGDTAWARGVAMDFLRTGTAGPRESARALLSSDLANDISKSNHFFGFGGYSKATITSEEVAANGNEVVISGTLKSEYDSVPDAVFRLRVVRDSKDGRWSIRFVEVGDKTTVP